MNVSPRGQSSDDKLKKQQDHTVDTLREAQNFVARLNRSVTEFKEFNKYANEFLDSAKKLDNNSGDASHNNHVPVSSQQDQNSQALQDFLIDPRR